MIVKNISIVIHGLLHTSVLSRMRTADNDSFKTGSFWGSAVEQNVTVAWETTIKCIAPRRIDAALQVWGWTQDTFGMTLREAEEQARE